MSATAGHFDAPRFPWWVAAIGLWSCTCNDPRPLDAERAGEMAAPHLEHFAGYERWAHRVLSAGVEFRRREALEEALFAPVRRDDEVAGAWVEREHAPTASLRDPPSLPSVRWTRLRHGRLGDLRVGRWEGGPCARGCVVLARGSPEGKGRLVVAYHEAGAGE